MTSKQNSFNEPRIITTTLLTSIVVQLILFSCAFIIFRVSIDKFNSYFFGSWFFICCLPAIFGLLSLFSIFRGLFLKNRKIVTLSIILGIGSIGLILGEGIWIAELNGWLALVPPPPPAVSVGQYPIQNVDTYANPGLVLWDTSHGNPHCPARRLYKLLIENLESAGYEFDVNGYGVLDLDISGYSVILLNVECGAAETPYSQEEANKLFEYVRAGGGLLLMGEHMDRPYSQHLDPVSQLFGIDLANDPYFSKVDKFSTHPITTDIQYLNFEAGGSIKVSPPAIPIGWNTPGDNGDNIGVAVAEVGEGRVVAVGDTSFWKYDFIYESEAEDFAINVFDWLSRWQKP